MVQNSSTNTIEAEKNPESAQEVLSEGQVNQVQVEVTQATSETAEQALEVMGNVGEAKEKKSEDAAGAKSKKGDDQKVQTQADKKLDRKIVEMTEIKLRREIEGVYKKEIRELHREKWMMKFKLKRFSPTRMNKIVSRVREIRELLSGLAEMAVKALRLAYKKMFSKKD